MQPKNPAASGSNSDLWRVPLRSRRILWRRQQVEKFARLADGVGGHRRQVACHGVRIVRVVAPLPKLIQLKGDAPTFAVIEKRSEPAVIVRRVVGIKAPQLRQRIAPELTELNIAPQREQFMRTTRFPSEVRCTLLNFEVSQ